jgi:hypothetical protein
MRKHRIKTASLTRLGAETASVIALRTGLLMMNLAPPDEAKRMAAEKAPALLEAAQAAISAAAMSAFFNPFNPIAQMNAANAAWARSLTRKVKANRKRIIRQR